MNHLEQEACELAARYTATELRQLRTMLRDWIETKLRRAGPHRTLATGKATPPGKPVKQWPELRVRVLLPLEGDEG